MTSSPLAGGAYKIVCGPLSNPNKVIPETLPPGYRWVLMHTERHLRSITYHILIEPPEQDTE